MWTDQTRCSRDSQNTNSRRDERIGQLPLAELRRTHMRRCTEAGTSTPASIRLLDSGVSICSLPVAHTQRGTKTKKTRPGLLEQASPHFSHHIVRWFEPEQPHGRRSLLDRTRSWELKHRRSNPAFPSILTAVTRNRGPVSHAGSRRKREGPKTRVTHRQELMSAGFPLSASTLSV